MRRTYRSKKDHGGTLDHKDVLLNMDEKSSAFDAFYIQNIKQTKRELSCVASANHLGIASNKVRKRKYVKRIVKEAEPVSRRGTMSSSAYLTPDKSIRVNKVLDPFDMLLNSSPACQNVPRAENDHILKKILPKKEGKTYNRNKLPKVKKFNYSRDSSCTDSDKENTSDSQSNITDIRTHELLVEKESSNSPKYLDESINKVANNLSLLNRFKRERFNGSFNTSYKSCKHRLTMTSPVVQKSPLCSTPFKEKYRGVSIFKFSPISQKEGCPNNVTISEENEKANSSAILVCKNIHVKDFQQCKALPLAFLANHSIQFKASLTDEIDSSSNGSKHVNNSKIEHIDNEIEYEPKSVTYVGENSFQITEDEPFLGFSNNETEINVTNKHLQLESLIENYSNEEENIDNNEIALKIDVTTKDESKNISSSSTPSNNCTPRQSSRGSQSTNGASLYDSCNSDQSSLVDDHINNKEPIVAIEKLSDSIFFEYYAKMPAEYDDEEMSRETHESDYGDMSKQTENDDFESLANDSIEDGINNNSSSADSDCVDIKPNTIVITDSSTTEDLVSSNAEDADDEDEEKYVSFVTTRRRNEITNDSLFLFNNSYVSNSTDCDKTVLSNVKVNLDMSNVKLHIENTSDHDLGNGNTNLKDCIKKDSDSSDTGTYKIATTISTKKSPPLSSHSNNNELVNAIPDLIHTDNPSDVRISRISTRKSSRLPRQSVESTPTLAGDNEIKSSNKVTGERKAKISTRKSAKMPKRSYFTSSELNGSKNEITLMEPNEANNTTVVENHTTSSDSNDSKKIDAESSLINKSASLMLKVNDHHPDRSSYAGTELKQAIVLQPGKKWERSLSIYRRMSMVPDHFDQSILDDECLHKKGRKYRQSVISTMEMQECRDPLHNDSINSRRSTFISKPSRPTIRFVKDPNISRASLNTSSVFDDLKGFLNEECDDTVIELSKLSIADSEHEVTIINNFHESERLTTARDYVLRRCNQTEPILFDDCYPETVLKNCHKIGEGVYGEVFLWRGRDGRARVMKIVPIAGTVKVNGEDQKDFHEIISEIVIAMELSALRAPIADIERQLDEGNDIHALDLHAIENATDTFNEVLAVRCVYGAYPSRLLDLWELYDECKGSENDSPAALPTDQRFIVLELANAGQDLESYQFASAQQAHALFQQIAFGVAVGEEAFQFEHRDLHWGNVLIAPTEQKLATFILRGRTYRTPRCGVAATVIDYSLSRLTLPLAADSAALYNDLATDDQLFDAVGDYQFEVYRLMRDKLGNDWKNFEPYTNILWLHYTVDKMITALRYKRTNTKIHKHYIEKLKGIKNRILEYGSAVEYVLADIEF